MPRTIVPAATSQSKPYDRESRTTLSFPITAKPSGGQKKSGAGGGGYDKTLLVTLVLKSAKDVKWDELADKIGKTPTQCKDVWRKVVLPALVANKQWTASAKGWMEGMKVDLMAHVLAAVNPDWEAMTSAFPGKTKTQINDIWRKVILPRLKRGDTIE